MVLTPVRTADDDGASDFCAEQIYSEMLIFQQILNAVRRAVTEYIRNATLSLDEPFGVLTSPNSSKEL